MARSPGFEFQQLFSDRDLGQVLFLETQFPHWRDGASSNT